MPEDIQDWLEESGVVYDPDETEVEITYDDILLALDNEDRLWK